MVINAAPKTDLRCAYHPYVTRNAASVRPFTDRALETDAGDQMICDACFNAVVVRGWPGQMWPSPLGYYVSVNSMSGAKR